MSLLVFGWAVFDNRNGMARSECRLQTGKEPPPAGSPDLPTVFRLSRWGRSSGIAKAGSGFTKRRAGPLSQDLFPIEILPELSVEHGETRPL